MGQSISVDDTTLLGDVLMVSFDRSLSGQDGESFGVETGDTGTIPAQLATRLFGLGIEIDHVYVMSNTASLRRPKGWDDPTLAAVTETVVNFFRFYPGSEPLADEEEATDSAVEES